MVAGASVVTNIMEPLSRYINFPETIAVSSNGSIALCQKLQDGIGYNPVMVQRATGGLLEMPAHGDSYYQYTPVICGGTRYSDVDNYEWLDYHCYQLAVGQFGTTDTVIGTMSQVRFGAASVTIRLGSTLWVSGGGTIQAPHDSTEYLDIDKSASTLAPDKILKSRPGPRMPRALMGHCLEMVTEDLAILYGGWESIGGGRPTRQSWTLDLDEPTINLDNTDSWTERATMAMRRERHSCGVLRDAASPEDRKIIVAAGGCSHHVGGHADGQVLVTDSVELLHTNGPVFALNWLPGPKMPAPLCGAAATSSAPMSGKGTRMYVAGGVTDFSEAPWQVSGSVYSLQCRWTLCEWAILALDLLEPRAMAVAMIVPLINQRDFSIDTPLPIPCQGGN